MSDLKSLLTRINSVKSTKKITKVMQMIAAAKLKNAQQSLSSAKTFADRIKDSIARLAANNKIPQVKNGRKITIVISSDKGLCGGYNSSVIKLFKNRFDLKDKNSEIIFVGKKAYEVLKRGVKDYKTEVLPADLNFEKVTDFVFSKGQDVKHLEVFYTKFESAMSLVPKFVSVLPIKISELSKSNIKNAEYMCEPSSSAVMRNLVSMYVKSSVYLSIKESIASENMSRMLAMDSATKNAQNVVEDLLLLYNRSRQDKITKELIEVVSGAEAI